MRDEQKSLEERLLNLEKELELEKAEGQKYKRLFEMSADALSIIDLSSGKFIECNRAAIELHGVESEENFLNLGPSDLSPEFQPCGEKSETLANKYIENTVSSGSQVFQWTHSRLDGSTFPCLVSLALVQLDGRSLVLAIGRDISELTETQFKLEKAYSEVKQLQFAYTEEKEKFEQFVNLAPVGIAINRFEDGAFEYVNKEFSHFTGYDVDELNQMDYWQLTPKKYEKQEQEQLSSLEKEGRYGPYKKEYIHKQGYTYPVLLSGIKIAKTPSQHFIWSVVQDISKQQHIEERLQAAKKEADLRSFKMKLANDSAEIGVWEWDVRSNELIWDELMYKLYGVSKEEFSGAYEAWEKRVHPDDINKAKELLVQAVEGKGVYDPEFRVVHPDGKIRTIKASAEIIRDAEGKASKVIGVNYDITEKVNAINELKLANREAERANRSKSEFLANMSHEIRTPMNAILGSLQLLGNIELTKEMRTILENASSSAKSLLTIINDILDYSKIEDNKLDLECESFVFKEVLNSVKFDVDSVASNKGIQLVCEIDPEFVDGWMGDVVRVKQIILNLVSNAVKFTESGRVKIGLRMDKYKGKDSVRIDVQDTGIGMSQEAKDRIFERFSQADSSTTRRFGGTGLGMSITVNLIKLMSGSIDIESSLGKGTDVCVLLPLKKANKHSVKEATKSVLVPKLNGKKILIAEDNEINQVIVQTMLKDTGAELTTVENGRLAIEAVKWEHFDLILMDIQMPEVDGVVALQEIRKLNKNIPTIALTANVMVGDVNHYIQQGFAEHIAKPIDLNTLYGALARYLK